MGAEAIYQLLQKVDLDSLSYELRDRANNDLSQQRKTEALKRLQVVEGFRASKGINKPEWMIMKIIPVTPPEPSSVGTIGWWSFCNIRLE